MADWPRPAGLLDVISFGFRFLADGFRGNQTCWAAELACTLYSRSMRRR